MKRIFITCSVSAGLTALAMGQESLDSDLRINGKRTLEVFSSQKEVIQNVSALVYRGYKRVAYGVIMSEDGYILTKASELEGRPPAPAAQAPGEDQAELKEEAQPLPPLTIRIGDGVLYEDVKVVKIDASWDIALLKVEASGLTPVQFVEDTELSHGTVVIANGASSRHQRRIKMGVVSAHAREITGPAPVVMGVALEEKEGKLFIQSIDKEGAADEAGLRVGDQIIQVDETPVSKRDALIELLMKKKPGDELKIKYLREGKKVSCVVRVMARPVASGAPPVSRNDSMSGRFSRRRDSFPRVMQVDVSMDDRSCGGPLINLSGQCVGLVIARANRAETFVVSAQEIKGIYESLLEGEGN